MGWVGGGTERGKEGKRESKGKRVKDGGKEREEGWEIPEERCRNRDRDGEAFHALTGGY